MRRFAPSAIALVSVALLSVAALAFLTLGCGGSGGGGSDSKSAAGAGSPGEKIFSTQGCSGCHTLEAAGATGKVGPSLDELRPNEQRVIKQVTNGGNGMPSFKSKLSPVEIKQVAAFVSTAAGAGKAGKISFGRRSRRMLRCRSALFSVEKCLPL